MDWVCFIRNDGQLLIWTLKTTISSCWHTPLPPPSCHQLSINPGAHLHSTVHHPPLGMWLCLQSRAEVTGFPDKRGGRGRWGKCLCWTTCGSGKRWKLPSGTTGKESGGRIHLRLWHHRGGDKGRRSSWWLPGDGRLQVHRLLHL